MKYFLITIFLVNALAAAWTALLIGVSGFEAAGREWFSLILNTTAALGMLLLILPDRRT